MNVCLDRAQFNIKQMRTNPSRSCVAYCTLIVHRERINIIIIIISSISERERETSMAYGPQHRSDLIAPNYLCKRTLRPANSGEIVSGSCRGGGRFCLLVPVLYAHANFHNFPTSFVQMLGGRARLSRLRGGHRIRSDAVLEELSVPDVRRYAALDGLSR